MVNTKYSILRALALAAAVMTGASAQSGGTLTNVSMASYGPIVAPDSIASAWGTNLTTGTAAANGLPLLTFLGNTQVSIVDSKGVMVSAPLYLASPGQINYVVPSTVALGRATVTVTSGSATNTGALQVSNVAPAIITANGSGKGVPAAQVLRVTSAGAATYESPFQSSGNPPSFVTTPIRLSGTDQVYLTLFASGVRRHSLNPVQATIGGVKVPVLYAGAQSQFPGLDQINLGPLPSSLAGKGEVDLIITVDGVPANTVRVALQ